MEARTPAGHKEQGWMHVDHRSTTQSLWLSLAVRGVLARTRQRKVFLSSESNKEEAMICIYPIRTYTRTIFLSLEEHQGGILNIDER